MGPLGILIVTLPLCLPINCLVKIDAVAAAAYQMITLIVSVEIFATTQRIYSVIFNHLRQKRQSHIWLKLQESSRLRGQVNPSRTSDTFPIFFFCNKSDRKLNDIPMLCSDRSSPENIVSICDVSVCLCVFAQYSNLNTILLTVERIEKIYSSVRKERYS